MEHEYIATKSIMPMSMFTLAYRMLIMVPGRKSLSSACILVLHTRT
jgi:hypothetical protein